MATPPTTPGPPPAPPRAPYRGAPAYRFVPRWGFAPLPWLPAAPAPRPRTDALATTRSLAATVVPLLWATAVTALTAAGAEVWRYVLLLISREEALGPAAVAVSDALVAAAGTVAPILAALSGVVLVLWCLRAVRAAADRAGALPPRSDRAVVLGWVVPLWNLVVPGAVLAEIEHAATDRPPTERPRPSRFVLVWWGLWVLGELLAVLVLLWSLRSGVQAMADGVVLHALLDLVAAAVAVCSARLVVHLTTLLGPFTVPPRELLVAVNPA